MTRDITQIPLDELIADRAASANDIGVCRDAIRVLSTGTVTSASGRTYTVADIPEIRDRIDDNREIVRIINAEIVRRIRES